jgi:hypothetical protein
MNNENIARINTVWTMIFVMIITLIFGEISPAQASVKEMIVYNKNILYINKYNNLVNIKDIINIDYKYILKSDKKIKTKTLYLINDLSSRSTFLMPEYSQELNLKTTRVDKRVIISRLANALKSHETGGAGAYYRKSRSSSACGAYQYMPSTWNNYKGYKDACHAPEWIQDQKIILELNATYNKYHDWEKAIAAHLLPSRAGNKATWNKPVRGNPTVREYVNSVLNKANLVIA